LNIDEIEAWWILHSTFNIFSIQQPWIKTISLWIYFELNLYYICEKYQYDCDSQHKTELPINTFKYNGPLIRINNTRVIYFCLWSLLKQKTKTIETLIKYFLLIFDMPLSVLKLHIFNINTCIHLITDRTKVHFMKILQSVSRI